MTDKEWLQSLSVEDRLLAISTIFFKPHTIINSIREDLDKNAAENRDLESQNYRLTFHPTSNDDYNNIVENGYSRMDNYNSL